MKKNKVRFIASCFLLICAAFLVSCTLIPSTPEKESRSFTILAINDVYRLDGVSQGALGGLARVRTLREGLEKDTPDLLVLHAGDFLFPSILSRQYQGEQMVDVLNYLDGDAKAFDSRMFITFGNHEFDRSKLKHVPMLKSRIEESQFRWLGSNIQFATDSRGNPLVEADQLISSTIVESGGVKIGMFSLSTDFVVPEYVQSIEDPIKVARKMTAQLREQGAEVVVALTHLLVSQDVDLLKKLGAAGPDLVVGGHEHKRQEVNVDGRWVLKADADAISATVITGTVKSDGMLEVDYEFKTLDNMVSKDAFVQARVEHWNSRYDKDYCVGVLNEPPGCLNTELSVANLPLVAEELQIRMYETNLGNWVSDRALEAFADQGAQIAFINSGGLRLNQNIPSGGRIMTKHIEELFAYPSPMKLISIDGKTLYKVLARATDDWTGNGWWLQIAGFAYRFDPESGKISDVSLLTENGPKPVGPDDRILAVAGDFMINGGDGYSMLNSGQVIYDPEPAIDLKDLVVRRLKEAGSTGIAPGVEGRICNSKAGPCLLI